MVILNAPKIRKGREESKLLNAWLWEEHRNNLQWRNVRLGPLPDHEKARMFMVTLRFADAIFLEDGYVNIVEAKLKPNGGAIGQLLQYKKLFPLTHAFKDLKDKPIKLILLAPYLSLDIVEFAKDHNIKYVLWDPDPNVRAELKRRKESLLSSL